MAVKQTIKRSSLLGFVKKTISYAFRKVRTIVQDSKTPLKKPETHEYSSNSWPEDHRGYNSFDEAIWESLGQASKTNDEYYRQLNEFTLKACYEKPAASNTYQPVLIKFTLNLQHTNRNNEYYARTNSEVVYFTLPLIRFFPTQLLLRAKNGQNANRVVIKSLTKAGDQKPTYVKINAGLLELPMGLENLVHLCQTETLPVHSETLNK